MDEELLVLEVMLLDVTDDADEDEQLDEVQVEELLENEVTEDEVDLVIVAEVDDETEVTDYILHITLHIVDEIEVMDETDTQVKVEIEETDDVFLLNLIHNLYEVKVETDETHISETEVEVETDEVLLVLIIIMYDEVEETEVIQYVLVDEIDELDVIVLVVVRINQDSENDETVDTDTLNEVMVEMLQADDGEDEVMDEIHMQVMLEMDDVHTMLTIEKVETLTQVMVETEVTECLLIDILCEVQVKLVTQHIELEVDEVTDSLEVGKLMVEQLEECEETEVMDELEEMLHHMMLEVLEVDELEVMHTDDNIDYYYIFDAVDIITVQIEAEVEVETEVMVDVSIVVVLDIDTEETEVTVDQVLQSELSIIETLHSEVYQLLDELEELDDVLVTQQDIDANDVIDNLEHLLFENGELLNF